MVKGITRQVVVVNGPDPKLFEQAIFLVREDAIANGGITEEALLNEARLVCKNARPAAGWITRIIWAAGGAFCTGLIWLFLSLV